MTQVDYEPAQHTAALLEGARRRLVETGTRNRLVHVNRTTKRSNTLTVINERADDIFGILKTDSRKMKFAATKSEEEDEPDELQFSPGHSDQEFDENRYTDQFLETPLTPDGLQKRLLKLARDTRTAEEEQRRKNKGSTSFTWRLASFDGLSQGIPVFSENPPWFSCQWNW